MVFRKIGGLNEYELQVGIFLKNRLEQSKSKIVIKVKQQCHEE